MITFYPRNIGMWRKEFDFNPPTTLTPKEKTNYKVFHTHAEFREFLKDHGVRVDDPEFPLMINFCGTHGALGDGVYEVIHWTLLGWIKDDYR